MTAPPPPELRTLEPVSAWRGSPCWECDEPVTDDEVVIWDGRIWHLKHWTGDLAALRHGRVVGADLETTTCSGAKKPHHQG